MKILALSDFHGQLPKLRLKSVDMILIAGDVCPVYDHSLWFQRYWLEHDFYEWLRWLKVPVYLTLGNHDFVADFKAPPNLRYGTETIVDGILLFSWTPVFNNWAWMAGEEIIYAKLERLLRGGAPRLWLTHGPPLGTGDETAGRSGGSRALRDAVLAYRPELLVCGHLHEGSAQGRLGDTEIRNVSLLNDQYKFRQGPTPLDWP